MKTGERLAVLADNWLPKSKATRATWLIALAFSLVLMTLPWIVRLDGKPHADWQQFLGRFHPLAVHLPIALLLLVPLLELAGTLRPALREAAGFVLGLAFISCLGSLLLGFLLAYGGGSAGTTISRHMAGGITLTILAMFCLLARPWWERHSVAYVYPALLAGTLLALIWTAHQGGTLSHGSNYLTQYMPPELKRWTGLEEAPAAGSFYAKHINPIFDSNCVSCHGAGQVKGGLRLDTYEGVMKGGQDGIVIVAGQPEKSMLLTRVTLPTGHKQLMPAEGKPPLSAEQIAWIRAWIAQGASPSAISLAGIDLHEQQAEPPPQPVGDYSALMPEIRQMDQAQGPKLKQLSGKPEDGLILFTVDSAATFNDAQLKQFEKFAPYIVDAELGRTAVTNASFDTLKQFTHLRALHLEGTQITGDGLAKLAPLSQLTYINLSGTQVTPAAVTPLSAMKNLRHIYLYNTPAEPPPPPPPDPPSALSPNAGKSAAP